MSEYRYDPAAIYGRLTPTPMIQEPVYGAGLDEAIKSSSESSHQGADSTAEGRKEMARAARSGMSAGGSLGSVLTGAGATGLMTGAGAATGGGALAAGLALSYMEQKKQEEAAHERAVIEEAQNRKVAVQNAINAQINAARMLSV